MFYNIKMILYFQVLSRYSRTERRWKDLRQLKQIQYKLKLLGLKAYLLKTSLHNYLGNVF